MRRRRRPHAGLTLGRVLGLGLVLVLFATAGFILTLQRNPGATVHHYAQQPASETGTLQRRHHRHPSHPRGSVERPTSETTAPQEVTSPKPAVETHQPTATARGPFREVARGSTSSPRVAVTFDAGADSSPTPEILDVLAKHGVHATFFLTGKWIEKNRGMARRIVADGHEIGNHTYSHKRLTELDSGQIADEFDRTEQLALEVTGRSTKPYARVPYGARDKRVLKTLSDLGYRSIYWDLDSWDSVKKGITSAQIESRVLGKIRDGSIVLMHCGSKATADGLDSLLGKLESEGYRTGTVSDLLSADQ